MLVLADTVDLSIRHQGVSGNDTGQAPPRVCFTCDAQLFCLLLFVFSNCCQICGARSVPWGGAIEQILMAPTTRFQIWKVLLQTKKDHVGSMLVNFDLTKEAKDAFVRRQNMI